MLRWCAIEQPRATANAGFGSQDSPRGRVALSWCPENLCFSGTSMGYWILVDSRASTIGNPKSGSVHLQQYISLVWSFPTTGNEDTGPSTPERHDHAGLDLEECEDPLLLKGGRPGHMSRPWSASLVLRGRRFCREYTAHLSPPSAPAVHDFGQREVHHPRHRAAPRYTWVGRARGGGGLATSLGRGGRERKRLVRARTVGE